MHANIFFRQTVAVSLVGWDGMHCSPHIPPIPSFVFLCTAVSLSVDEMNNAMWCYDQKYQSSDGWCQDIHERVERRQASFRKTQRHFDGERAGWESRGQQQVLASWRKTKSEGSDKREQPYYCLLVGVGNDLRFMVIKNCVQDSTEVRHMVILIRTQSHWRS